MEPKINPDDFKGVNPIERPWHDGMSNHDFALGFFIYSKDETFRYKDGTPITGFNFDPYVTDNDGNKVYYQRGLVWTLEQKQNFIESLYLGLNCGVVVLKMNDYVTAKEVGAEYDVVDGKQRISAIIEFVNNEFPDLHGNYYKDFSKVAVRKFGQLRAMDGWVIGPEGSDKLVKRAFLNVNHTGVPMSKEHIDFVKSINL